MARSKDVFANIIAQRVTETAANTLTFAEIATGIGLTQGVGLILDKLEWDPKTAALAVANFNADADEIEVALTSSNALADLTGFNDRRILIKDGIYMHNGAAAISQQIMQKPFVKCFDIPLIVATPKLYLAVKSTGMAAANTIDFRLYFRYVDLKIEEYLELAESFVLTG